VKKSLYEILGVQQNATQVQIDSAYAALKQEMEARHRGGDRDASNELLFLKDAYAVLSDPIKRDRYDNKRAAAQFRPDSACATRQSHMHTVEPSGKNAKPSNDEDAANVKVCSTCGKSLTLPVNFCPHCGNKYPLDTTESNGHVIYEEVPPVVRLRSAMLRHKLAIATAGALFLLAGAFVPIVSFPVVGNVNLFLNGTGPYGYVFIALSLGSLYLIYLRGDYRWLLLPGTIGGLIAVWMLVNLVLIIWRFRSGLEEGLAGNPFAGIGRLLVQSVKLQWGWAVLAAGAVALITVALLSLDTSHARFKTQLLEHKYRWINGGAALTLFLVLYFFPPISNDVNGLKNRSTKSTFGATPTQWEVSNSVSQMDDIQTLALRLEADSPSSSLGRPNVLIVRCRKWDLDVYVSTATSVKREYRSDQHQVRIRFDTNLPNAEGWGYSTSGDALFAPDANRILRQILHSKTMLFEYESLLSGRTEARFSVTGLDKHIEKLRRAGCPLLDTSPKRSRNTVPLPTTDVPNLSRVNDITASQSRSYYRIPFKGKHIETWEWEAKKDEKYRDANCYFSTVPPQWYRGPPQSVYEICNSKTKTRTVMETRSVTFTNGVVTSMEKGRPTTTS